MSFARIAAMVAAGLVLWGGLASAAGPIRAFQAGLWSGGAYTDDRTGDFTHCSAGVAYDSGINMFVLVTAEYRWWLGFINPQWDFSRNAKMPVELRFDDGPWLSLVSTVPSRMIVLAPLPPDPRLIDRLSHSSQLDLSAKGRSFLFKISGAPAITAELRSCVRKSLASRTPGAAEAPATTASASFTTATDPPAAANIGPTPPATWSSPATASSIATTSPEHPAPAAQTGSESAALKTEVTPEATRAGSAGGPAGASAALDIPKPPPAAASPAFSPPPTQTAVTLPPATALSLDEVRLARDFLAAAQLPDARLVVTDKPAALANFTAVWRAENAAGAVRIVQSGPEVSGIGIASNLISVDPLMCKGNFASARSRANVGNTVVITAVLSCADADAQRTAEYFITPRGKGEFVVFAIVRSSAVGASARFDQHRIDLFTRAAVRAAAGG